MDRKQRMKNAALRMNKMAGYKVAYNLDVDENPASVKQWIPTGSRWLDSIIARGMYSGIPTGKIVELAGLPSTGKSYMAMQIAINALRMDIDVVYFDEEAALDQEFIEKMGVPKEDILVVQAGSVEMVLEFIERWLSENDHPTLFIWDSLAMTACASEIEGDFNPNSQIGVRPRVLSRGLKKLVVPLAKNNSTLLICNQLYTNISTNRYEMLSEPYVSPGGKAIKHAYSLSIWLKEHKSKKFFVEDNEGSIVGSQVSAQIKKSRFGSYNRECEFKILWAGKDISIQDEESWIEVIKKSDQVTTGAWWTMKFKDGTEKKFRSADWMKELEDLRFKDRVIELMDDVLIHNFKNECVLHQEEEQEEV